MENCTTVGTLEHCDNTVKVGADDRFGGVSRFIVTVVVVVVILVCPSADFSIMAFVLLGVSISSVYVSTCATFFFFFLNFK